MGTFRKLKDGEDVESNNTEDNLEEQYQKMFKKIARDFVFKDDLKAIIGFLFDDIDDNTFEEKFDAAYLKALEYKDNLSKPLKQRKKYEDIVDDE